MDYRKLLIGAGAVVVVGLLVWVAVDRLGDESPAPGHSSASSDSSASSESITLTGETLEGQPFDLAEYKGKPVVLNFWATWCGYCVQEMPELVEFARAHPEATVIGVNVNDDQDAATAFVARQGITFPNVYDPNGELFNRFASRGLPTTVFLNADLEVTDTVVGATDMSGFEAGLQTAE